VRAEKTPPATPTRGPTRLQAGESRLRALPPALRACPLAPCAFSGAAGATDSQPPRLSGRCSRRRTPPGRPVRPGVGRRPPTHAGSLRTRMCRGVTGRTRGSAQAGAAGCAAGSLMPRGRPRRGGPSRAQGWWGRADLRASPRARTRGRLLSQRVKCGALPLGPPSGPATTPTAAYRRNRLWAESSSMICGTKHTVSRIHEQGKKKHSLKTHKLGRSSVAGSRRRAGGGDVRRRARQVAGAR